MSRIGKNPIEIPQGVTVEVQDGTVVVKGPKGELSHTFRPEIEVNVADGIVSTTVKNDYANVDAFWGLTRAIINNMIIGVTEGFEKKLELVGVGYRVKANDAHSITLSVGYSHVVDFKAPESIQLEVDGNTSISVKGIDKQLVGLTAAKIRAVRKPEPYKGKGIRYSDEVVRRKAGKTGKA
jgi:large subunit ribosomal protein L6